MSQAGGRTDCDTNSVFVLSPVDYSAVGATVQAVVLDQWSTGH